MSHLKNSLLYRVKYLWYSILALFLKGSRTYFTGKKLKYKFLKEGTKPSARATSTMSQQNKKMASHLGEHRYKPFDNNLLRLQTIKNLISNQAKKTDYNLVASCVTMDIIYQLEGIHIDHH